VKTEGDVDFVPTIFAHSKSKQSTTQSKILRYQRLIQRRKLTHTTSKRRASKSGTVVEADDNVQQIVEVSSLIIVYL